MTVLRLEDEGQLLCGKPEQFVALSLIYGKSGILISTGSWQRGEGQAEVSLCILTVHQRSCNDCHGQLGRHLNTGSMVVTLSRPPDQPSIKVSREHNPS
jgi:hypothetical protein